jgi:hypothetical protein
MLPSPSTSVSITSPTLPAAFQQPERVVGFFNTYRQLYPFSRNVVRGIAERRVRIFRRVRVG